jgi:hypothetical protein
MSLFFLSRQLVESTAQMNQQYRTYKAKYDTPTWKNYMATTHYVAKLKNLLEKIEEATIDEQKAKWWLDFGVYGEHYRQVLEFSHPEDTHSLACLRHEQAISKAHNEYMASCKRLTDLEASIFETIPESDRRSLIGAELDRYIERERQLRSLERELKVAEDRCNEVVEKIRRTI